MTQVRKIVGDDFLFGIRLSAADHNHLPINLRLPLVFPLRDYWFGNTLEQTLIYARELEQLGVDYLHIDSGFGFINPKGNPGDYPFDSLKLFANSTRHLSLKAAFRATLVNLIPPSSPAIRSAMDGNSRRRLMPTMRRPSSGI